MTMTKQCWRCLRYRGDLFCDAFPKGIPQSILEGEVDHSKVYTGDKGLVFKPIPDELMKSEVAYDFTKEIADRDDKKYEKVKAELMRLGFFETDFMEGGVFYGWSTNELIDLAKQKGE